MVVNTKIGYLNLICVYNGEKTYCVSIPVHDMDRSGEYFNFFYDEVEVWRGYAWGGRWGNRVDKYTAGLYRIGMIKHPLTKKIAHNDS